MNNKKAKMFRRLARGVSTGVPEVVYNPWEGKTGDTRGTPCTMGYCTRKMTKDMKKASYL